MGTRSLADPRIVARVSSTVRNLLFDGVVAACAHTNLNYNLTLTSGVGANQANRAWQTLNQPMANGAQEIIDLYGYAGRDIGAGTADDGLGQELIMEEIVAIMVVNENAITLPGQLEVTPSAANGWTPIGIHTVALEGALRGQGFLLKAQPAEAAFEVVNGANHRITLRANGGPVTYSVYVMGRSDDEASSSSSSVSSPSSESSRSESSQSMSTSSSESSSSSVTSSESSSSLSSPSSESSASSVTSSSSSVTSSESSSSVTSSSSSVTSSSSGTSSSSSVTSSSSSVTSSSSQSSESSSSWSSVSSPSSSSPSSQSTSSSTSSSSWSSQS